MAEKPNPRSEPRGKDLFIVDNSDTDWKVKSYLQEWTEVAHQFDIATGYFEVGALLALDGQWQKLDKVRILMGDEVSLRTKRAFTNGLAKVEMALDASIEKEKETNDFLHGVPGIVEGIRSNKIECRVYTKDKFHAKAFITHGKLAVVGSTALVGSSNFTYPGLTDNVELNVQIQREVKDLQEWYERHWNEAKDVSEDVLRVIERHTREFTPFEVYVKALQEFFRGHELTASEWELTKSLMYPKLDQYQKEGYHALLKIAMQHKGAFLCDGVGLGKTFIGMMLIERLTMFDRKRVALFVPKAARKPVWEAALRKYLPNLGGDFTNLVIYNHTDLQRGGEYQSRLARLKDMADVVIIDEAHHFRNPGVKGEGTKRPSRYWHMFDLCEGKTVFMLTATPINNSLLDFQHMIELFSRRESAYFQNTVGIHSLAGHFRKLEKALERAVGIGVEQMELPIEVNQAEAAEVITGDPLLTKLVVQRSRAYVRKSQEQHDGRTAIFPERQAPQVADYSIKKTYGRLLKMLEDAFNKEKPLFSLAIYYPLAYYKGPNDAIDTKLENRQKQVVSLIRTQFLKRFESSARAFQMSCQALMLKLLAFATKHSTSITEKHRLERWKGQHEDLIGYVREHQHEFWGDAEEDDADADIITDEMMEDIDELHEDEYNIDEILSETFLDLDQVAAFLQELQKFKPSHDDKLKALVKLLKSDPVLKEHKVIIFSEYMATARYLRKQLEEQGFTRVDEVDSASKKDRGVVITRFAPYYNDSSSGKLAEEGHDETGILIATDVLSEGLNLQDATRLINYDLHWNPVRLMQRIGRVDRRMNPDVEAAILKDHPEQEKIRGKVAYWNFLPPDELDELLRLYSLVSHKTLKISKTLGIEGKKLLRPEDDYEALKDFNHAYEGTPSGDEAMHLEYQRLLKEHPGLEERLNALPKRVFSGKEHPKPGTKAVFFCFSLPAFDTSVKLEEGDPETNAWTDDAGLTQWYLYDLATENIHTDAAEIFTVIQSEPDTPRHRSVTDETLSEIRAKVERHVKNTYFKQVQAPVGVRATLKCWMELS
ncbi:MAG: DEAD/DEAH box helicase family protein [Candidatus Hydrogenedentes bacterium]|nr:DEAD/DEAH box helicase family protein [Candidatus Hydrogenedentota bacterium]